MKMRVRGVRHTFNGCCSQSARLEVAISIGSECLEKNFDGRLPCHSLLMISQSVIFWFL
jgi:hypothetical protein